MRWELRLQRDEYSIDAAAAKDRDFPDWYQNPPPIFPGDEFYLRAFWQMSSCRHFAGGPIPWDLIAQYAAAWELSAGMTVVFSVVIRKMDEAYLEWSADEQERLAQQKRKSKQGKIGRAFSRMRGQRD